MKVIVEFDLPEGQAIPDPRDIVRLTDPDWIASWWHIDDIIQQDNGAEDEPYSDLTHEEAREVLRLMDKYHDCDVGINWDVIDSWIDHVKAQRKEVA
jgi:hypothetical protein